MTRETKKSKLQRAMFVHKQFLKRYPNPKCALNYDDDPFKLLIAVMLSAQTTDKGVNLVTPKLWAKYPTPIALASADIFELEQIIKPIGTYKVKASNAISCAQLLVSDYGGVVPNNMDDLQKFRGVGRKTANVILTEYFGISEGIAVDTHVFRIAKRLKFSLADSASACEQDLLKLYPEQCWSRVNSCWVLFGREVCTAKKPKCEHCEIKEICPSC